MTALTLCATCGNHGTTGNGRDRKPCLDCEFGREIAETLAQARRELAALTDDAWEPACSCGGDPATCPANQAVAAEIAAGNEDGAR